MDAFVRRAVSVTVPRNLLVTAGIGVVTVLSVTPAIAQGVATWTPMPPIKKGETAAETWARRTEEAIVHRTPGLDPQHLDPKQSDRDGSRGEPQSVWNSLAATWLAIVLAGLLLLVAGAVHRWLQADRGDGPTSILK